ncbi:hypothetical protein [Chryseobacterium sp.]|jgi:uncharacterized protein YcfL|uniref:hypothetical protein n=1 Tax=Chryseobacterium sp. TaxID=1871047 RepID=UPI002848167B|nr:hypothetical protein [Chryseobacterium sp.]MDR3026005.1 hypothetical protein [Chryseobacterium sp.]
MKKLLLLFFSLTIIFSCKSEKDKLLEKIEDNTIIYINNLSSKLNANISDFKIIKVDTIRTKQKQELITNLIHEHYINQHDQVVKLRNDMARAENLYNLSKSINNEALSDIDRRDYLNLKNKYDQDSHFENHLYEEYLKSKSKINEIKNNNIEFFNVHFSFKLKNSDTSIQNVNNELYASKEGEIYNQEEFINSLLKY